MVGNPIIKLCSEQYQGNTTHEGEEWLLYRALLLLLTKGHMLTSGT